MWKIVKPGATCFENITVALLSEDKEIKVYYNVIVSKRPKGKGNWRTFISTADNSLSGFWEDLEPNILGWEYQYKIDRRLISPLIKRC